MKTIAQIINTVLKWIGYSLPVTSVAFFLFVGFYYKEGVAIIFGGLGLISLIIALYEWSEKQLTK